MEAVTNDSFLKEKLGHFVAYLKTILKKHLANARFAEFEKKIGELEAIDIAQFLTYVITEMVPYKTNVAQFVGKLLKDNDVDSAALAPEERTKLGRYVSCFIETAQQ